MGKLLGQCPILHSAGEPEVRGKLKSLNKAETKTEAKYCGIGSN